MDQSMFNRLCQAAISADDQEGWTITRRDAENIVRAVLKELREPTNEMVGAALPEAWIGHPEANAGSVERWWASHRKAAVDKWRAMIDAALSPTQRAVMPNTIARTHHGCFVCTACGEPASSEDIEWDECSVCGGEGFAGDDDADDEHD